MWHIVTAQKPLSRWFSTPCQTQSQSSSLWGTPLMPCWKKSEFNSDTVGNSSGCFPLLLPRHKTPGMRFRSSHLLARQTANTWYFLLSFFFLGLLWLQTELPETLGLRWKAVNNSRENSTYIPLQPRENFWLFPPQNHFSVHQSCIISSGATK